MPYPDRLADLNDTVSDRRLIASARVVMLAGMDPSRPVSGASQPTALPAYMRAAVIDAFGGPEGIRVRPCAIPEPGAGELLVRVYAAGINPIDWLTRAGRGVDVPAFPAVLGWDLCGYVVLAGPGRGRFAPGAFVFGLSRFPGLAGAYADYAVVPEGDLALAPGGIDPSGVAAAPMAALTAWQSLYQLARVTTGQRVLVHGAAGGVGHIAVQLAKARGAEVFATASPQNHVFVSSLGADHVIDYRTDWIGKRARDLDVILDPLGGPEFAKLVRALRPGGTIVTLKGRDPAHDAAVRAGVRVAYTYVAPNGATLEQIAGLMADGTVRVHVERTFGLDEIGEAHAIGEQGHGRGKLAVLTSGAE